jgi:ribosome-associated protein
MPESEKNLPDPLSKTQRKNAMLELQKLGETLISLSKSQLAKIPLEDELLQAILFVHTLKTHESKRRQLQYIGKIMRNIDPEPIKAALKKIHK